MTVAAVRTPQSSGTRARTREVGQRILQGVFALFVLCTLTFLLTNLQSPTAIAKQQLPVYERTDPAAIRNYIEAHHLDEPTLDRLGNYYKDLITLNLGTSNVSNTSVASSIFPRLGRTLILSGAALLIGLPLALWLGAVSALKTGTRLTGLIDAITLTVSGIPVFVLSVGVLYILGIWLPLFPIQSAIAFEYGDTASKAEAYILPCLALILAITPYVTRLAKAAFRDVLSTPYMQAAMLRGLSGRRLLLGYAAPNAMVVLAQILALSVVSAVTGAVIIENIFAFPGIGQLLVSSVENGDHLVVQGGVLVTGAVMILASVLADLLAIRFDPRLRQ